MRLRSLSRGLMSPNIADLLARKSLIAVAVLAALVLGNEVLVQPYIMQLSTDAPLINTAGRQRMLSQRLAKAALAFEAGTAERAKDYLDEMREVLGLWSVAHEQLLRGDAQASRAGRVSALVRQALEGLEPSFVKMQAAAQRVIQGGATDRPDVGSVRQGTAAILDNEAEYLREMDRVVGLYEIEARGRVKACVESAWRSRARPSQRSRQSVCSSCAQRSD
jgi:hypothetical protein